MAMRRTLIERRNDKIYDGLHFRNDIDFGRLFRDESDIVPIEDEPDYTLPND